MEIIDKNTGEITTIDSDIIDTMLSALKELQAQEAEIRDARMDIENQLGMMALNIDNGSKTKRIIGNKNAVKVTIREYTKWDKKKLDEIKNEVGENTFFKYFRVDKYAPNAREIKKLASTLGSDGLMMSFNSAKETTIGKPAIEFEEVRNG